MNTPFKQIFFRRSALALATLATLAACSSVPERNAALDLARSRFDAAKSQTQVTSLAADELKRAADALRKAEAAHQEGQSIARVDHLAYLASQQVAVTQDTASSRAAQAAVSYTHLDVYKRQQGRRVIAGPRSGGDPAQGAHQDRQRHRQDDQGGDKARSEEGIGHLHGATHPVQRAAGVGAMAQVLCELRRIAGEQGRAGQWQGWVEGRGKHEPMLMGRARPVCPPAHGRSADQSCLLYTSRCV